MKLGLGFAPAVNERAVAFAVTSSEAFTDLFNACVDEQATQLGRTPKQRSASQELNSSGAAHVTVFSGAEPDDIHHDHFQNVPNNQKSDVVRPRRPSVNKLVPQANPQLDESAMEALSVKPVKVRRERRLSVDADRLRIDALIDDDSGRSLAATVFDDELGGAATAARRKERRRSTDGSIMAGARTQYAPHPRPPPAPLRPRAFRPCAPPPTPSSLACPRSSCRPWMRRSRRTHWASWRRNHWSRLTSPGAGAALSRCPRCCNPYSDANPNPYPNPYPNLTPALTPTRWPPCLRTRWRSSARSTTRGIAGGGGGSRRSRRPRSARSCICSPSYLPTWWVPTRATA